MISGGGSEAAADVLLPKTAVRENLTLQNFFDSNNLLGSNDRSLRGNVAFGAARSVPPDFENYLVSPGVPTGWTGTCLKNCSPSGESAVEYVLKISMLVLPYLLLRMLDLAVLVV